MKSALSFLFAILFSASCFAQLTKERVIHVSGQKSYQSYEHFNRLVLDSYDSHAEFIEGFDFEWGFDYKLKVLETELAEVLSDGTRFNYALIEVLEKRELSKDVEFNLYVDSEFYPSLENDSKALEKKDEFTYQYLNDVELVIPQNLMSSFEALLKSSNGKACVFRFINGQQILLVKIKS